jgi:hypothetical protein
MSALAIENAEWADGPLVAQWLEQVGADCKLMPAARQRMIQRWRAGSRANFYSIDEILISLDLHPSMLPEDIWRAYDNGARRQAVKTAEHAGDLAERRAA